MISVYKFNRINKDQPIITPESEIKCDKKVIKNFAKNHGISGQDSDRSVRVTLPEGIITDIYIIKDKVEQYIIEGLVEANEFIRTDGSNK